MREIDEIRIEGEEDGWHLIIEDDTGSRVRYRIGLPDQFKAEVDRTIGAWLTEGEQARFHDTRREDFEREHMSTAGGSRVELDDAYEASDPKHPNYHERWAEEGRWGATSA